MASHGEGVPDRVAAEILLTPPPNDQMVNILNKIFGPNWSQLDKAGKPDEFSTLLFELMGAFNSIILASVAVLIFYVIAVGVIGTASEGQPLGKRYSTLWTPLRASFSVSLLIPLPFLKVSLLQVILLKMVYFGIGAAGYGATVAYDYIDKHAGFISNNQQIDDSHQLAIQMLQPLVVQAYYDNIFSQKNTTVLEILPEREVVHDDDGVKHYSYVYGFKLPESLETQFGDSSIMGQVRLNCGKFKNAACAARRQATIDMRYDLMKVAITIASTQRNMVGIDDQEPLSIWSFKSQEKHNKEVAEKQKLGSDGIRLVNDEIARITSIYTATIYSALTSSKEEASVEHKAKLKKTIAEAKDQGFGALGTWYWTINNFSMAAANIYKDSTSFQDGDIARLQKASYKGMTKYLARLETIASEAKRKQLAGLAGASSVGGHKGRMLEFFSDFHLMDPAYKSISEGDPIANLQDYGHTILAVAETAVVAYLIAKAFAEGGLAVSEGLSNQPIVGSVASVVSGPLKAITATLESLGTAMLFIVAPLLILGVTLAYYLPAVPFILWTMALIGWLLLVVESLIAAPLWAAAHAIPEGEGMSGQHGKQGYMLFMNVLMRPPLMVFGFFISVVLMQAVGNFIGNSFGTFASGLNANFITGIPTFFFMMFLVGAITVVVAHKVFALVTWLPDNVMRWVGQQVQNLGEGGDEQRTRSIIAGVASTTGGAVPRGDPNKGKAGAQTPGGKLPGEKGGEPGEKGGEKSGEKGQHSPTNIKSGEDAGAGAGGAGGGGAGAGGAGAGGAGAGAGAGGGGAGGGAGGAGSGGAGAGGAGGAGGGGAGGGATNIKPK